MKAPIAFGMLLWLIALTVFVVTQEVGDIRRWGWVGERLHALETRQDKNGPGT